MDKNLRINPYLKQLNNTRKVTYVTLGFTFISLDCQKVLFEFRPKDFVVSGLVKTEGGISVNNRITFPSKEFVCRFFALA